ncbi:MAG: phospholipase D-like domain-containing protein [Bacteroidales bacterium]|jgi:HKD family nuclease|nr:phospholipase D-like domain-containing protein [Bacteroidales bacterium]
MKLQVLSNINYPIGNLINFELQQASEVRIAVAFMKVTGIKVIENSMKSCLQNNGKIEIITGLDFKTTDPKSIQYILNLKKDFPNLGFYCYGDKQNNKTNIVFHPKIYLFSNQKEKTSIIGSTNLTGGGLTTNFEVNTIIKEDKPQYFSQLEAIYNSVKFTDTIFTPDEEYLMRYSWIYKAIEKNETKALEDKKVKKEILVIKKKEEELPGTIPTMKQLIIEAIKQLSKGQNEYVSLQAIGDYVLKIIENQKLNYSMKNYRQILRKCIYFDLVGYGGQYNKELFETKGKFSGLFKLTSKGYEYKGR